MTREELVQRVKVKLEEYSPFDYDKNDMIALQDVEAGSQLLEINPIYSYIEASLDDSCNEVLKTIPLHMITPRVLDAAPTFETIKGSSYYKGIYNLPNDYLRLHSVQLTDWVRPIMEVSSYEREDGVFSGNIYTMGKPTRPIVIEDYGISEEKMTKQLHCFSSRSNNNESPLRYVPKFETEDAGETGDAEGNCDKLADLYALMTAMNVQLIYGNENAYKQLSAEYQLLIKANEY
jgi:hypothetical protein